MEQDNELQRLEKFVENLLANFTELRAEKVNLLQDIRERDEIIEGLRENVNSQDTERTEISLRVNKIVDQIEEWEQGLDDSEFEEVSVKKKNDLEMTENEEEANIAAEDASLAEEQEMMESLKDDEGKGQQNLFS